MTTNIAQGRISTVGVGRARERGMVGVGIRVGAMDGALSVEVGATVGLTGVAVTSGMTLKGIAIVCPVDKSVAIIV